MDLTPSLWEGLLRRASSLHRRYGDIPGGPEDTRSLALRAIVKFRDGGMPAANDRDHLFAIWTKALCSVLNDARRRQKTAAKHGYEIQVPLEEEHLCTDARDEEALAHMICALRDLAHLDAEAGEQKARILTLRYLAGLPWKDIAAELGSSITSVRREAQFAIAWMRDQLTARGVSLDQQAWREAR